MIWTELKFSRHKGKTLPQIMFKDPDWFFWAYEEGVFKDRTIKLEAEEIYRKATNIKIPNDPDGNLAVEYIMHMPTSKYGNFEILDKDTPRHTGGSLTSRSDHIDMSIPRGISQYDKSGYKIFINTLKYHLFKKDKVVMTKARCEDFYNNDSNFILDLDKYEFKKSKDSKGDKKSSSFKQKPLF